MSERKLRIVFMGTPAFAVPSLDAVLRRGHDVLGVFTQPDRPAGRGRRLRPSPVKAFAERNGLPVLQPASLRSDEAACDQIVSMEPDAIVVAAYGLFLPEAVLKIPRHGCLNIHPSLLPKYRGPSPVISTILEGEKITGVTIMLLDEGMDTGPVLAQEKAAIGNEETSYELTLRLFELGADLLVQTLDEWVSGEVIPSTQNHDEATITRLLKREDGMLDWSESAATIDRRIRAFTPWPGTFTSWRGMTLKVLRGRAAPVEFQAEPGTVCVGEDERVVVVTGSGALELEEVQLEGRAKSGALDFARGQRDLIGSVLGA